MVVSSPIHVCTDVNCSLSEGTKTDLFPAIQNTSYRNSSMHQSLKILNKKPSNEKKTTLFNKLFHQKIEYFNPNVFFKFWAQVCLVAKLITTRFTTAQQPTPLGKQLPSSQHPWEDNFPAANTPGKTNAQRPTHLGRQLPSSQHPWEDNCPAANRVETKCRIGALSTTLGFTKHKAHNRYCYE